MVADVTRTSALEQQVDSLSTQLANSYEELSLIYQTSSGMRVDRRPREFFTQACKSLLDILAPQGWGRHCSRRRRTTRCSAAA